MHHLKYVHYGLNQDQQRRKNKSNADFRSPAPLCGNGSIHVRCETRTGRVDCPDCKAILASHPHYL